MRRNSRDPVAWRQRRGEGLTFGFHRPRRAFQARLRGRAGSQDPADPRTARTGAPWRRRNSALKTLRRGAAVLMTLKSGVGPTKDRRERARAVRSNPRNAAERARPPVSPYESDPQAGRPARRVPGAEDGRRRSRRVPGESCRAPFAASSACPSLAASGGVRRPSTFRRFHRSPTFPPLAGVVEIGRAHDVRRWRRFRLRPARSPTPRRSGRGRRVRGRGFVASRRTTHRPPSPRRAIALARRTPRPPFTSTPYRRRSSRRRRGPVPCGSSVRGNGARHPQVGPTRRRARPAPESPPWQTKC